MWTRISYHGIDDMDFNKDGWVDLTEYTTFVVFQINKAIVVQQASTMDE